MTRRCVGHSPRTIIYEMHVSGFHPASQAPACRNGRAAPIAGLIEKIPYLQDLGITAVELLPVFQFDAQDLPAGRGQLLGIRSRSRSSRRIRRTARGGTRSARWTNSATWSRRCTAPGIEVILDVVFNHTAEGDHRGPDALLPRHRQPRLLHPGAGPLAVRRITAAAATRSTPTIRSSAA